MSGELVKRLRWLVFMFPETHPAEDDTDRISNNIHLICQQAADVIEELSKQNEKWEDVVKTALDFIPCWVSVTERLPEDRSDVLAYLKYEVGGRIAAANYDKGMWQDCVMGGLYRTEEGVVTHWMPIPQPPKEET